MISDHFNNLPVHVPLSGTGEVADGSKNGSCAREELVPVKVPCYKRREDATTAQTTQRRPLSLSTTTEVSSGILTKNNDPDATKGTTRICPGFDSVEFTSNNESKSLYPLVGKAKQFECMMEDRLIRKWFLGDVDYDTYKRARASVLKEGTSETDCLSGGGVDGVSGPQTATGSSSNCIGGDNSSFSSNAEASDTFLDIHFDSSEWSAAWNDEANSIGAGTPMTGIQTFNTNLVAKNGLRGGDPVRLMAENEDPYAPENIFD